MNRIEFMTELAALLQDIPVVERQEAMKYYNDYFDDAGEENEHQVIEELESPAKVAATIKADLGTQETVQQSENYGEFTETGYRDTRFEKKDVPVNRTAQGNEKNYYGAGGYQNGGSAYQDPYSDNRYRNSREEPPKSSPLLKIILIIAIIVVGAPVIIPVAFALIAVVIAAVVAVFALFISIVIASAAVAVTGVVIFCAGIVALIPEIAVGIGLMGTGLVLAVLGVIGVVVSVRICIIVFPGVIRGIVTVFSRIFHRRAVA